MIALLDVNVLIALVDSLHVHHAPATQFFRTAQREGWATCPLTENGLLRITERPTALHGPDSPAAARTLLHSLLSMPGHQFWSDDVSLTNIRRFPSLSTSRALTDLYLLGLAVKHGGRFATFDQNINSAPIPGGSTALLLIPS